jgi:hypothetical protein
MYKLIAVIGIVLASCSSSIKEPYNPNIIRLRGTVTPTVSGSYTFWVSGATGFRLKVDGLVLLNRWDNTSTTVYEASLDLEASAAYDLILESKDSRDVKLEWQPPSGQRQPLIQQQLGSELNVDSGTKILQDSQVWKKLGQKIDVKTALATAGTSYTQLTFADQSGSSGLYFSVIDKLKPLILLRLQFNTSRPNPRDFIRV